MYLGLWGAGCQWAMYRNNRLGFSRCSDVWICLIWSDQIKQGRAWWGLCMGALGILCLENKCRLVISVCLGIRMLGVIWLYRVLGCVLQHKLSTSFSPLNAKESHNRLTPLQLPWGLNEIMHVKCWALHTGSSSTQLYQTVTFKPWCSRCWRLRFHRNEIWVNTADHWGRGGLRMFLEDFSELSGLSISA